MNRRRLGVGAVSALLTILLLVAGFAVSTGMLSAVYVSQAEVMRRAVNVGDAVAERLQAYVYEDVRTNRTLLTVRNVGSTGSEVEYMMAVGYGGEVLAEARLGETLRLGTQQALTIPLSDLLGDGFDNYTEVRSQMATLYLKTVKGGVFGSGYMAPPSVMTAAYATSTTTVTTEETYTETLPIETGTQTITSWTATVIMPNPDHWPMESYVGVAYAHNFRNTAGQIQTVGFPNWGLQGVNSTDKIRIPMWVTCWKQGRTGVYGWGGSSPVTRFSSLGPTYTHVIYSGNYYDKPLCPEGGELFEPKGTTKRHHLIGVWAPNTVTTGLWTQTFTASGRTYISDPTTTTIVTTWTYHPIPRPVTTTTITWTYTTTVTTAPGEPPSTITHVLQRTTTVRWSRNAIITVSTPVTFTRGNIFASLTGTATVTDTYRIHLPGGPITTLTGDYRDIQKVSFPGEIAATNTWYSGNQWWFYRDVFRLAYVKVVNLWNTTEVLAFLDTSQTADRTIELKVDRPVGLAAVYFFNRHEERLPPPPRGGEVNPGCIEEVRICPTYDYGTAIRKTSSGIDAGPCGSLDGRVTVTFKCEPGVENCGAWIAPGPGTYSKDQLQPCQSSGNTWTCDAPAGSTIIAGVAKPKQQS